MIRREEPGRALGDIEQRGQVDHRKAARAAQAFSLPFRDAG